VNRNNPNAIRATSITMIATRVPGRTD
jgi:hypothetical protein